MVRFQKLKNWLAQACAKIEDETVRKMFSQCFLSTLDTTTELLPDGTTYIFTGDIPAMWLRDSSAQVSHYLHLLNVDEDVQSLVKGLLRRQAMYINIDPYANAFNKHDDGANAGHEDFPVPSGWVWERKYEVDSLCSYLDLLLKYYCQTSDDSIFDQQFCSAFEAILNVFSLEQHHNERSDYCFLRKGEFAEDTLPCDGKGAEVAYTGMTWSGFRPSDDKCEYGYLIPSNLYAARVLRDVSKLDIVQTRYRQQADRALALAVEIDDGVKKYGTIEVDGFGWIYVYETDGLGNLLLMDDANVPSLLSLPYIGYCDIEDEVYQNTRRFVLSRSNPYYYEGKYASGIGSPHTPQNFIWPIALCVQALTTLDQEEREGIIRMLKDTHAGTHFMHESFDKDNPADYTREWFAWANSLFAELIISHFKLV